MLVRPASLWPVPIAGIFCGLKRPLRAALRPIRFLISFVVVLAIVVVVIVISIVVMLLLLRSLALSSRVLIVGPLGVIRSLAFLV